MGAVYRAEQVSGDLQMASTVILVGDNLTANQRFLLGGGLTTQRDHPDIVETFDLGRTTEGMLYWGMRRLSGETLSANFERDGSKNTFVCSTLS